MTQVPQRILSFGEVQENKRTVAAFKLKKSSYRGGRPNKYTAFNGSRTLGYGVSEAAARKIIDQ